MRFPRFLPPSLSIPVLKPKPGLADCPSCGSLQPYDVHPGIQERQVPDFAICMSCCNWIPDVFPEPEVESA
jgi:hypothetical protein